MIDVVNVTPVKRLPLEDEHGSDCFTRSFSRISQNMTPRNLS